MKRGPLPFQRQSLQPPARCSALTFWEHRAGTRITQLHKGQQTNLQELGLRAWCRNFANHWQFSTKFGGFCITFYHLLVILESSSPQKQPHPYSVCFGGRKYVNTELRLPYLKDSIHCFISLKSPCCSHPQQAVTALSVQHTWAGHKSREVKCPCLESAKPL